LFCNVKKLTYFEFPGSAKREKEPLKKSKIRLFYGAYKNEGMVYIFCCK
jgi:hypothetical protein